MNFKLNSAKLKMKLLGMAGLCLSVILSVHAEVQLPHGQFHFTTTDLQVKVLGGYASVKRTWYDKRWQINRAWNSLKLTYPSSGSALIGVYASIERNGDLYKPADGDANLYVFDTKKRIRKTSTGFRWENVHGDWIEYDSDGVATRYGDRNDVTVSIERDTEGNISGILDHFDNKVISFEYTDGQLTAVEDTSTPPRRVEYTYDGELISSVKDVLDYEWQYSYTATSQMETATDPELRTTTFTYDANGRVAQIESHDQAVLKYDYNYDKTRREYYVRTTSAAGVIEEKFYDRNGMMIRRDIGGETQLTITKEDNTKTEKDRNGNITMREYDNLDRLVKIILPDNSIRSYAYENTFSKLSQRVNENGVIEAYEYDNKGNLLKYTEAQGLSEQRITEYTYDTYGYVETRTTRADANTAATLTQYDYDNQGNLISVTDAENNVTGYEYDILGNVTLQRDARSFEWLAEYDAAGQRISSTTPLGFKESYEYDKVSNLITVTDARKNITRFEYDDRNNRIKTIDANGGIHITNYDKDGRVIKETSQENKSASFAYDAFGRRDTVTNGNGYVTRFEYAQANAPGSGHHVQPAIVHYPTYKQYYQYDNRNRTKTVTAVLGQEGLVFGTSYDSLGNTIVNTDSNGKQSFYDYDALNRQTKVTDTGGFSKWAEYDNRDNPVKITDARQQVHRFEVDGNNQLIKEIRPLGQVTSYAYDRTGNVIEKTDALGQKTEYGYDADGRQTSAKLYASTDLVNPVQTISFGYDANGNLTSWNDGQHSGSFIYDNLNQKLQETVNNGSFSLSFSYTYYKDGFRKTYTGPDGITYSYSYDNNNELTAIQIPGQGAITYNAYNWSAPTKITLPGGSTREISYNGLLNPQSIIVKDPAANILSNMQLKYGKMQHVLEKNTEKGDQSYTYDELYRLTNSDHSAEGIENFSMDEVGNRTGSSVSATVWQYNENDELQDDGVATYSYDANGNLTSKVTAGGTQNYFYDVSNRLIRVEDGVGAVIARYAYDPFDRRLYKDVSGVTTYFLHSDEGLVGEFDAGGVQTTAYGYAPGSIWTTDPLFIKNSSGYFYYHNDHLGTPQKLTSASGEVVWAAHYEAYGSAAVVTTAGITNNLRFSGQYYDSETGLHYNWRRYYDPQTGRYITTDPVGTGGLGNLYIYADANPITYIDPTGECAVGGIAAGVAIAKAEALITGECFQYGVLDGVLDGLCVGVAWKGLKLGWKYGGKLVGGAVSLGKKGLKRLGKAADKASDWIKCKTGFNSFTGDTLVHTKEG